MQLDMNLERLRLAVDDLLVKLAEKFANPKLQHLFLLNNYDMTISVLKVSFLPVEIIMLYSFQFFWVYCDYLFQEAGDEAKKVQRYFEEKLESNMISFVVNLSYHPFLYLQLLCIIILLSYYWTGSHLWVLLVC